MYFIPQGQDVLFDLFLLPRNGPKCNLWLRPADGGGILNFRCEILCTVCYWWRRGYTEGAGRHFSLSEDFILVGKFSFKSPNFWGN